MSASSSLFWKSRHGLLMGALIATSVWGWWVVALPVLSLDEVTRHVGHVPAVYLHTVGGTGMLLCGAVNFYLAATRRNWHWHRVSGRLYLALGAVGASSAIAILLTRFHKPTDGTIFTNTTVSLLTLAAGWMACAAMGLRAVRNKRFDSHRDWMVRSYILVWSFVACRIVSRATMLEEGPSGEWLIWLSWVGPLMLGELILQWNAGAKLKGRKAPTHEH